MKTNLRVIFSLSFVVVLAAHTFLVRYQGFLTPISIFLIVVLLFYYVKNYRDIWGLLLIIFISNHFSLGETNGGAISYIAIFIPFLLILNDIKIPKLTNHVLFFSFFVVLIISVLFGQLESEFEPIGQSLTGFVKLFSNIIIFWFASNIVIDKEKIRNLIHVIGILIIYNVFVTINQRFEFLYFNFYTAFLPPSNRSLAGTGEIIQQSADNLSFQLTDNVRPMGTIMHFELLGEYALLAFILFLAFYITKQDIVKRKTLMIYLLSSFFLLLNTLNRWPLVLLPMSFILVIYFTIVKYKSYFKPNWFIILLPLISLFVYYFYSGFIQSTALYSRFEEETTIGIIPINRYEFWLSAISSLGSLSLFGLGMRGGGVFFETEFIGVPPHSLYLALPFYYGWIGASLFIVILIVTMVKLYKSVNLFKEIELKTFSLAFFLIWVAFMLDEYKIDILRLALYQNIIYFFFGICWAQISSKKISKEIIQ